MARIQVKTLAAQLLANGTTRGETIRLIVQQSGVTSQLAAKLCNEVIREWQADYDAEASYHRSTQLVRLQRDLTRMRNPPRNQDGSAPRINWNAVARHEELIAKITGTIAPVKVSVLDPTASRRDALGAVMDALSDEEMDAILAHGEDVDAGSVAAE